MGCISGVGAAAAARPRDDDATSYRFACPPAPTSRSSASALAPTDRVDFPGLPGCTSGGLSRDDAMERAVEALTSHIREHAAAETSQASRQSGCDRRAAAEFSQRARPSDQPPRKWWPPGSPPRYLVQPGPNASFPLPAASSESSPAGLNHLPPRNLSPCIEEKPKRRSIVGLL